MIPAWLLDIVAAIMLAVAAVSAARLAAARPWRRGSVVIDTDIAHVLMALAMAGMLSARFTTLPAGAWEVVFAVLTAWFAARVALDARASGVRALAGGHCAPHLVHSAAMLYMFLALAAPPAGITEGGGMSGMGGMSGLAGSASMMSLRYPTLAFAFALVLVGYSIWDLDQLSGRRYSAATAQLPLAGQAAAVPVTVSAGPPGSGLAAEPPAAVPAVAEGGAGALLISPAVTVGCRIAMGIAMVFMLVIAL